MQAETADQRQIIGLFKEIYKSIRKYGLPKIINTLHDLNEDFKDPEQEGAMNYIIDSTCNAYNVSIRELIESRKRGDVAQARSMCFVLFKKHLDVSEYDIARYFSRSRGVVSVSLMKFKKLNRENKIDAKTLEIHDRLDSDIARYRRDIFEQYSKKQKNG